MEGQFLWNISIHGARSSGALTPGVWHHYASTYDGREVAAYVDGVLIASRPAASMTYTLDDLTIGCDRNDGVLGLHFDGMVDDVRLYARALPAAEVAVLAAL